MPTFILSEKFFSLVVAEFYQNNYCSIWYCLLGLSSGNCYFLKSKPLKWPFKKENVLDTGATDWFVVVNFRY